jgi:hypothetical protein
MTHMRKKLFRRLLLGSLFLATAAVAEESGVDLATGFENPPVEAKPQTWWHWTSGNVSKEGITADLEAMKKIGLGGFQLFTVEQSSVKGPVTFMSPEWRSLVQYTVQEAARLDLEMGMEGCEGWTETGGTWIQPAQSMQKVIWAEKQVVGGKLIPLDVPQPKGVRNGYYEDIALYAFPSTGEPLSEPVSITSNDPLYKKEKLSQSGEASALAIPNPDQPFWILLEYEKPVSFSTIFFEATRQGGHPIDPGFIWKLQSSADGSKFEDVAKFHCLITGAFPKTTAKYFRILADKAPPETKALQNVRISLGGFRLDALEAKIGLESESIRIAESNSQAIADSELIGKGKLADLTGKKEWQAPEGNWTLLRIGHTSTGIAPHPVKMGGLECDKFSEAAVRHHLQSFFGPIFEDSPKNVGNTLKTILLDSWEVHGENWTPLMKEEFQKRCGYDMTPWLPALSGKAVESLDQTERFLWDYRRVLVELLAERHYGTIQNFAHEHQMILMAEATGPGTPTMTDQLLSKKYTDIPMGEFWLSWKYKTGTDDGREAACAAHIYGKKFAAAEAFTASTGEAAWKNTPYLLKTMGDQIFCSGINRLVMHRYAHQPWLDRKPGMSMGPWGINFERTNTWWEQGIAWIRYITRCQYLLQQGLFHADICYYYGEDTPSCVKTKSLQPAPPRGYNFDVCNADALLNYMSVKDAKITLDSGIQYRVLVLPDLERMSLPVLRKLEKLVQEGATVYGRKPLRTPSLRGYPSSEQELTKLADAMWGNCDGKVVTEHAYGKGKIIWGMPLEKALSVPTDFVAAQPGDIRFIHRLVNEADIYFVANTDRQSFSSVCTFRVSGKIPELWYPDTGKREKIPLYKDSDGTTTLPIFFEPYGSVFVVFRQRSASNHPSSYTFKSPDGSSTPTGLAIQKATFGTDSVNVDVTGKLNSLIKGNALSIQVSSDDLGVPDPTPGIKKRLEVAYSVNGQSNSKTATEWTSLKISADVPDVNHPQVRFYANDQNAAVMEAWQNGSCELTFSDGQTKTVAIKDVAAPLEITGSWELNFPPNLGAPAKVTFEKLISWTQSPDSGVKYFSGSAIYEKEFSVPESLFGKNRRLYLDLGSVRELAEVSVNGKSLGVLWKEPFRVDITNIVKTGTNHLSVKVTNLWPNRLIGDQNLPEAQRITWASVNLYKADSPLLPSGLLGPVKIIPTEVLEISAK